MIRGDVKGGSDRTAPKRTSPEHTDAKDYPTNVDDDVDLAALRRVDGAALGAINFTGVSRHVPSASRPARARRPTKGYAAYALEKSKGNGFRAFSQGSFGDVSQNKPEKKNPDRRGPNRCQATE